MKNTIDELGKEETQLKILQFAKEHQLPESLHIDYVCNIWCAHPELAPRRPKKKKSLSALEYLEYCVLKFKHGYDERISVRKSKVPGTIPDNAVNIIIGSVLHCHDVIHLHRIVYAHRIGMSAENILGLLLEEFLFNQLSPHGWAMAWGETIRSVDFCNVDGYMLQVKNRSNSENSSSSKIRLGKPIEKWYRVNAANGQYEWEKLISIVGNDLADELNEAKFQNFIEETLQRNPLALAIEDGNPWSNHSNGNES